MTLTRKRLFRLVAADAARQGTTTPPAPAKRKRRKLRQIMADMAKAAKA